MDNQNKNDFPDLNFLAGEFWVSPLEFGLDDSTTHEIELLKLYAYIIWPTADMSNDRRTFLAHCALHLQHGYNRLADEVRQLQRPPFRKDWLKRFYNRTRDLSEEHLLLPSGGLYAALERGRIEIEADIDRRLREANTALIVGDFILRYLVHMENGRQTASVNKAVSFIEGGGYPNCDLSLRRHKHEIMAAWSQCKPSVIFSLAAFYSEPLFISNILQKSGPSGALEKICANDLRRQRFLRVAKYCARELSNFTPTRSKTPLLSCGSGIPITHLDNLNECRPALKPFSAEEREAILKYRVSKKESK